jgi:tetratricopeptide (TPR) repeat protein
LWYLTQGRYSEAIAEGERALDIDPLASRCSFNIGFIHYFARQYVLAIDQLKKAQELDPAFAPAHQWCAFSYAQMGMPQHAVAELQKGLELARDELQSKALWGMIDALNGNPFEARKALEMLRRELQPPNFSYAYSCAVIHVLLGERDEAFACLEMACQERFALLAYLAIDQNMESLHSDPRFRQLLLTIGVPTSELESTWPRSKGAEVLPL